MNSCWPSLTKSPSRNAISVSCPVTCDRIEIAAYASTLPIAAMSTGTSLSSTVAVTTGAGPASPPRPLPPRPPGPAADVLLPHPLRAMHDARNKPTRTARVRTMRLQRPESPAAASAFRAAAISPRRGKGGKPDPTRQHRARPAHDKRAYSRLSRIIYRSGRHLMSLYVTLTYRRAVQGAAEADPETKN